MQGAVGGAILNFMKTWAKAVACFLIAWMPFLGLPAQAAFCPAMSSTVGAHQHMQSSHAPTVARCEQGAKHIGTSAEHDCHGAAGGVLCCVLAIPVAYAPATVNASPVQQAVVHSLTEQFIPQLPAPPPRSL